MNPSVPPVKGLVGGLWSHPNLLREGGWVGVFGKQNSTTLYSLYVLVLRCSSILIKEIEIALFEKTIITA